MSPHQLLVCAFLNFQVTGTVDIFWVPTCQCVHVISYIAKKLYFSEFLVYRDLVNTTS